MAPLSSGWVGVWFYRSVPAVAGLVADVSRLSLRPCRTGWSCGTEWAWHLGCGCGSGAVLEVYSTQLTSPCVVIIVDGYGVVVFGVIGLYVGVTCGLLLLHIQLIQNKKRPISFEIGRLNHNFIPSSRTPSQCRRRGLLGADLR